MSATYREKLLDPRWQRVRLEKLGAVDFTCQQCYGTEETLHVHHKRYVKGREPWEYQGHELVVLCKYCHEQAHEEKDRNSELVCFMDEDGPSSRTSIFAIAAGFLDIMKPDQSSRDCADNFRKIDPVSFHRGQVLAQLDLAGVRWMAYPEMASHMENRDESEFAIELCALLDKYGMRYSQDG